MKMSKLGLSVKSENLILKPLKKTHYKSFVNFSKEYDGSDVSLEEFENLQASKDFVFFQSGKLWLYLFEKQTDNKFEVGEIIGYVEITPLQDGGENISTLEIGYFIKESSRGKRYGSEMLKMTLELCENMDCDTVIAKVSESNASSIALLKSAGFEFQAKTNGEFLAKLKISKNKE